MQRFLIIEVGNFCYCKFTRQNQVYYYIIPFYFHSLVIPVFKNFRVGKRL